ncbi:MAG: acyloxyacyl hydrolase [Verrucomicrobia bacterium]|nr:acyloxyacyl hydrolase [Verrucomicrobiota bacterium]
MPRSLQMALLGMAVATGTGRALDAPMPPPWQAQAWNLESGVLWEVGTGTPFPYRLLQTQLSWRSAEFLGRELGDGSRLSLRHRLTLLGAVVQNAPEAHYVAFSGSPSLEWTNRGGTRTLFAGAGGGFGFIDSRGIKGGQGQDFTLNWFARGGMEQALSTQVRLTAAVMFQHLSNGGQTKPNPGVDALGFMLGVTWRR